MMWQFFLLIVIFVLGFVVGMFINRIFFTPEQECVMFYNLGDLEDLSATGERISELQEIIKGLGAQKKE